MFGAPTVTKGTADVVMRRLFPQANPFINRPTDWIHEVLAEHTWSGQDKILESVRDNRYTAVRSAHSTGKSHIASRCASWWVDTRPVDDVFIVTTAPSTTQVKAILWRYIKQAHKKASLPGYITDGDPPEWKIDGALVGYGRKPQDLTNAEEAATAFQGIHARHVLVILDEAGGIPEWLWNAVDTLVTSPMNRVLAIGNPDDPSSHFEKVCRPGSGWNVIRVRAMDTPAFTGEACHPSLLEVLVSPEWVEERRKRWGITSPLYIAKVMAEFPDVTDDTLISPKLVRQAHENDRSGHATVPGTFGMDVARYGRDQSCVYRSRGGQVRLVKAWSKTDTMETTGRAIMILRRRRFKITELVGRVEPIPTEPIPHNVPMWVDANGLGAGVYDRLREQGAPVHPFMGSERAYDPDRFANRRAETYWNFRERMEEGLIDLDPQDEELASQLQSIKWKTNSRGLILIESKDDMLKRGMPSPDRADAAVMADIPAPQLLDEDDYTDGESIMSDVMDRQF